MLGERTKSQPIEQTFLSGGRCCSPHSAAICSSVIHRCLGEPARRPGDDTPGAAKGRQHTRRRRWRRRAPHNSISIPIKTQPLLELTGPLSDRVSSSTVSVIWWWDIRFTHQRLPRIPWGCRACTPVNLMSSFLLHLHKTKDNKCCSSSRLEEEPLQTLHLLSVKSLCAGVR